LFHWVQAQKKQDKEWWQNCVINEFKKGFAKACSGKWAIKYKIAISGVKQQMITKHLCIFNGLCYNDETLYIKVSKNGENICTNNRNGFADWFIDSCFNNEQLLKYTNRVHGMEYTHYDDSFKWCKKKNKTLTISGKIQRRLIHDTLDLPWQKF
jgi:hypothetical protein